MTFRTSIAPAATALVAALTADTAMAGQYTAILEKAEAGYSVAVEVTDFDFGDVHVSSLRFGAINRNERGNSLSGGLVLSYDNTFSLSLNASNDKDLGELVFDFRATAVDMKTSYGLLNFEIGIQEGQFAGSLSLTEAGIWGLHDATFLAKVGETNIDFSLSGKTNYGLNLEATAAFNTKFAARNTLTLTISGNF